MSYAAQAIAWVLGVLADALHGASVVLRTAQIGALQTAIDHERATARRLKGKA